AKPAPAAAAGPTPNALPGVRTGVPAASAATTPAAVRAEKPYAGSSGAFQGSSGGKAENELSDQAKAQAILTQ
ncbi:hypothetical protein, partial [Aureimonas sp. AU4]|uniref:hypothetical protein n=1 Tax=Aureimonas sp. AU4 TaxID=1638163 RepID=UPI000B324126